MPTDPETYVLEWSHSSNGFHVHPLARALESGRAAFRENRRSDYVPIAAGTLDAVTALADELRPVLKGRQAVAVTTTEQMLAYLSSAFPTLWTRPLSEFGADWRGKEGVWTGADVSHVMPDGLPIFIEVLTDQPEYGATPVHSAFASWLAARGWGWERYDDTTFFLRPESDL